MKNETLHIRLKANMRRGLTNIKAWTFLTMFILLGAVVPQSAMAVGHTGNLKIGYNSNGSDHWTTSINDGGTIALGELESAPKLIGINAYTTKWEGGNICSGSVSVEGATYDATSINWKYNNSDNDQEFWFSINRTLSSTAGDHSITVTVTIKGGTTSSSCTSSYKRTFKITYTIVPACTQCCDKVEIKHPWGGGSWTYKTAEKCDGTVYSLEAKYGNYGCNWKLNDGSENWISQQDSKFILVGSPSSGDDCTFSFNTSNKTITITKVVTCDDNPDFSVSLSKSEVAVGCTGVTASITGDDRPTVTWSSSDPKVATIGSDGAIIINTAGTTTIIATTTEAGGFCGGVEEPATLTVRSPSVEVSPNKNSLCEDETLTLTATLTNCGADNSIQWYKGEDLLTGETKDQLTISSVTTTNSGEYKAVVTGGIICSSIESSAVTITVNALPSAPSLSNPEAICEGTTFTLPEKDDSKKTIKWVGVDNRTLTGLTVGEHTYTAKIVENGCESTTVDYTITVKEQLAKPDLAVTNVKQCGSNYTEGKIVINNYNPANTYILKKDGTPITKDYNEGYAISETETGEYTVEVSKDGACGATSDAKIIEVTNNTPTVNSFAITKQPNVCMGNPVTLSYDDTEQSGTVSYAWYEGTNREVLGTEKTFTIQQAKNATYKLVVTVTSNSCPANGEAEITVAPKAVPVAPTFDQDEMSACVGERFELPKPNNLIGEEEALWTVNGQPTTASQTINVADNYTYTAYKNDGCPSQGTEFIVHVNPLPIISISGSEKAVFYEDVTLTATATDGATVKWYEGGVEKGEGLTYVVTSATEPSKTVTAQAFLNGCESDEVSYTVNFEAEDECEHEIITHAEKTKVRVKKISNWNTIKIYAHSGQSSGNWPGTDMTAGTGEDAGYYVYTFESVGSNFKVIFNNGSSNGENQTVSATATKGKVCTYTIGANSCSEDSNSRRCLTVTTTDYKTTGDVIITTPAVKMLSAFSEEGSGELRMTAQIVKTGCNGDMTYYFKYRLKGAQEWSETAAQTATGLKPGDEINATVSGLNQGGTYEIQAVINNNNEAVSNILEYVVNIEETAISDVTLQFADAKGDVLQNQNQIYCVASTAYIKLSYRGTAHKSLEWIAENELQPVIGKDKLYSYVVRGNETITANVANDANEGTPATGTIDIKVYTIATTPDISINKTEVCSADQVGAKITVKAPQEGITYQAYKMVGDVETPHGEAVVADNAESIIINSIKETGTYYVKAWNAQCLDAIAVSLSKFAVTKIDASSNTIAISPETALTNPWMPVTVKVDKNSAYDYILVCKQGETDVTDQMVINKKGDSYVIKFPKPGSAVITDGQVVFGDIRYYVTVSLNGNVECGVTSATSTVTLTNLIEECD